MKSLQGEAKSGQPADELAQPATDLGHSGLGGQVVAVGQTVPVEDDDVYVVVLEEC